MENTPFVSNRRQIFQNTLSRIPLGEFQIYRNVCETCSLANLGFGFETMPATMKFQIRSSLAHLSPLRIPMDNFERP